MQVSSEAIVVVDSRTGRIVEANAAAANLDEQAAEAARRARSSPAMFDGPDTARVEDLMTALRATGRADDVALTLEGRQQQAVLGATIFRQENASFYLMRLQPMAAGASGIVVSKGQAAVVNAVRDLPEAFVVTDLERRILSANAAFLDAPSWAARSRRAASRSTAGWAVPASMSRCCSTAWPRMARCASSRRCCAASSAPSEDVEVSGVASPPGNPTCYGFSIRRVKPPRTRSPTPASAACCARSRR